MNSGTGVLFPSWQLLFRHLSITLMSKPLHTHLTLGFVVYLCSPSSPGLHRSAEVRQVSRAGRAPPLIPGPASLLACSDFSLEGEAPGLWWELRGPGDWGGQTGWAERIGPC